MADAHTTDLPETVSREAHQRMTDERNELKAKVQTLETTVRDLHTYDKVRRHFVEKGVEDADWAADVAVPSVTAKGVEGDAVASYLDEQFARLYPTGSQGTPQTQQVEQEVPTPDAVEPPSFARPSPAGDGAPPGQQKYRISDPEIQGLIQSGNKAEIERLDKAGQIEWYSAPPVLPG